jgi:DNA-directed RNA polymerase subunit E'/Rpb7
MVQDEIDGGFNMDCNFLRAEFTDFVKIHPKFIGKKITKHVLKILKETKEGLCSNHGYIKKDSINIIKVGHYTVEVATFHGYMNCAVTYEALVCNPVKGNIVNAKVVNMNNFGVLCASFIENDIPILEIIVPKHSISIQSDVDLQNDIKINDNVRVKIIGKKYQLFNNKISIIGKIVNDKTKVNIDNINESSKIDDEEYDYDEDDDDEDDEEENDEINDDQNENENENENDNDNDNDDKDNSIRNKADKKDDGDENESEEEDENEDEDDVTDESSDED